VAFAKGEPEKSGSYFGRDRVTAAVGDRAASALAEFIAATTTGRRHLAVESSSAVAASNSTCIGGYRCVAGLKKWRPGSPLDTIRTARRGDEKKTALRTGT
jgi:hypothetical protein